VFDGERLVPVGACLAERPRPDLLALERRLAWLTEGPLGYRAGDVLLLARGGEGRPVEERFHFERPHRAGHGGAGAADSLIPLVLAHAGRTGPALRDRLPVVDAHHLAAGLPLLVRGLYFEGYRPAGKPEKLDRAAFLARVGAALAAVGGGSPEAATRAVLRVLDAHLGGDGLGHVMRVLPEDLPELRPPELRPSAVPVP
jgi:uncharacterized protein (DUF2267 family)